MDNVFYTAAAFMALFLAIRSALHLSAVWTIIATDVWRRRAFTREAVLQAYDRDPSMRELVAGEWVPSALTLVVCFCSTFPEPVRHALASAAMVHLALLGLASACVLWKADSLRKHEALLQEKK